MTENMYYVYILRCANGAYYVGYTQDVEQRVLLHNQGRAATYTQRNGPVTLLYSESHPTEKSAMTRERQIKKWTRTKKEALINGDLDRLHKASKRKTITKL
ncbi:GIY-YIG nuclease family protein [Kiritimatiellota bacterium B12222]|nr:GIY-YIG nuclease family protein [Kiritimatiellota bacterium B12222]